MIRYTREMRGIPLWLLGEYLQELGGRLSPDGRINGDGWTATIKQLDDYQVGSLRVGQVLLDLEATPESWERIQTTLEKKLLRAGG